MAASIAGQHRRITALLERLGVGPENDLAGLKPPQQKQAERALETRQTLVALEARAAAQQIEFFGPRAWAGTYDRLAEITAAPGSRLADEKLTALVWAALPDGPFKRFQEVFCDPRDRIVPKCSIQRIEGRRVVTFDPEFNPRTATVLPCVVHIDRVPEVLLEDLGIADFSDLKRKPLERIERKSDLAVITTLKRVWDGATPLSPRSNRIFVVGKGDVGVDERYAPYSVPAEALGRLLVVRQVAEEDAIMRLKGARPAAPRDLQVQAYHHPGDVLRRIHHIGQGYIREIEQLKSIHMSMVQVHNELSRWRDLTPAARIELRAKVERVVKNAVKELGGALDFGKKRAGELASTAHVKDSRDQDNPPRAQLVFMRAIEKLVNRLERARSKEGYLHVDARAVEAAMLGADKTLLLYKDSVEQAGRKVARAPRWLFDERARPPHWASGVDGFLVGLHLDPREILTLDLQPYRDFGQALAKRCGEFDAAVRQADEGGAQDALVRLHVVAKLYLVAREVERMKIRIARVPEMTFEGVANAIGDVLARFEERDSVTRRPTTRLFPERSIAGLEEPFNLIRVGLQGVLTEVRAAGIHKLKGQLSLEAEHELMTQVREKLDGFSRGGPFDLRSALARLP